MQTAKGWTSLGGESMWGLMLQLTMNIANDRPVAQLRPGSYGYEPELQCEERVWDRVVRGARDAGANLLLIDVGDGVVYESHPEIAVRGAWSRARLAEKLAAARELGMTPIPKLNFSTTHHVWLGPYARMVSTPRYHEVCADLIAELCDLFGGPELFHLGMDEERAEQQTQREYVVLRQHDLWWHDLGRLLAEVARHGATPWVWSDHGWRVETRYYERMPRDVVQSNWHYYDFAAPLDERPRDLTSIDSHPAYLDLADHGFRQVMTGSNFRRSDNMVNTVRFALDHLTDRPPLGFLQTPWREMTAARLPVYEEALRGLEEARTTYENRIIHV